ncbi:MAG TPA: type II toxin-antitoxin system VapC family toxin [Spirochaetota bacterium]|mgnify:CR=1 FL=1|nr:type II toxin-antitoxin system VapC family toxin [Spirochaetota bacterium]
MKFLLDTNVCIKILKGNSQSISQKIETIDLRDIVIPSIVRYELFYGAYKSNKKEETLIILKEFLGCFSDAAFDMYISDVCGKIRADLDKAGTPIGPYDLQIGAIALANNYTLVTNNKREFSRIADLIIVDWEENPHVQK